MNNTTWIPTSSGGLRRSTTGSSDVTDTTSVDRVGRPSSSPDDPSAQTGTSEVRTESTVRPRLSRDTRSRAVVRIHPRGLGEIRLAWGEKLGIPGCEYLKRWAIETKLGALRIHKWTGPDDDRAKHDHPWWFLTFVLRGGYTDVGVDGDDHVRAPAVRFRKAEHQHTVVPDPDGALTFLITGPKTRQWGFWVNGRFRKAIKYFSMYGHHPCD